MSAVREHAFGFVQRLARELSLGHVELPSLPDVVIRVKVELARDDFDVGRLAQIISSEPVLAGRIMAMANSVRFRRGGVLARSLPTAITRLGASIVRNAALSFAMTQLRQATEFEGLEERLGPQWERSTQAAALAYALGRRTRKVNADEAMLAGLVHNIGVIYILSRCGEYPELFEDPEQADALIEQWHPSVGRAIAESWSLPAEVLEAVGNQQDRNGGDETGVTLTDALVASLLLIERGEDPDPEALSAPALRKLGLTAEDLMDIVAEAEAEAQELTAALGA